MKREPTRTLYDMLLYAGGVNTVADDKRLLVFNRSEARTAGRNSAPSQVEQRVA